MWAHDGIANNVVFEFFGERVPCSKVFPLTRKRNDSNVLSFLGYFVIK